MIDKIRTILLADSRVTDLTSSIWLEDVPQGQEPPYIILSMDSGDVNDSKNEVSGFDQNQLQVNTYGDRLYTSGSVVGAYTIIEAVRSALDHYEGTVSGTALYVRADSSPFTYNLTVPNKPLITAEMNFEVYETRS